MKILFFLIYGLAGCAGFLMAGAENNNFMAQIYCNISGAILFASGMLGLMKLIKEEEEEK